MDEGFYCSTITVIWQCLGTAPIHLFCQNLQHSEFWVFVILNAAETLPFKGIKI